jgi:hypothetical protein
VPTRLHAPVLEAAERFWKPAYHRDKPVYERERQMYGRSTCFLFRLSQGRRSAERENKLTYVASPNVATVAALGAQSQAARTLNKHSPQNNLCTRKNQYNVWRHWLSERKADDYLSCMNVHGSQLRTTHARHTCITWTRTHARTHTHIHAAVRSMRVTYVTGPGAGQGLLTQPKRKDRRSTPCVWERGREGPHAVPPALLYPPRACAR